MEYNPTELERKIIKYYRNNFPRKDICRLLDIPMNVLENRITKLRRKGLLKRWWQEEGKDE